MRSRRRIAAFAMAGLVLSATASFAQTDPWRATPDQAPLVSPYGAAFLRDLPASDSVFALMETVQPSIVSDRFSAGGLYPGQAARLGGFLSSWTQTVVRVDGVSITDPGGNGMPLLVPNLALWQQVRAGTGLAGADRSGTGLAIELQPIAPADRWVRTFEGATSHVGILCVSPQHGAASVLSTVVRQFCVCRENVSQLSGLPDCMPL